MAYPATDLYPQTTGLYPGGEAESEVNLWPSTTGLWPAATELFPGGGVGAEGPPTVVTGLVSDIGLSSAVFSGTVNPNSLTTHYYWEFDDGGVTASYNAGTGSEVVAVSKTIPLPSGTYMRVRLVALNGAGFGYGAWSEEFYTQTAPISEFLPDLITDAGRGQ